jgi:hypothetical protein
MSFTSIMTPGIGDAVNTTRETNSFAYASPRIDWNPCGAPDSCPDVEAVELVVVGNHASKRVRGQLHGWRFQLAIRMRTVATITVNNAYRVRSDDRENAST